MSLKNRYNGNKILPIALVHQDELNNGIAISSASLVITYSPLSPPLAPTNLQVSDVTATGCKLTWTASAITDSYVVYNGSTIVATVNTPAISTTITGLSQLTSYTLCVKAKNSAGESACSNSVSFSTSHNMAISGSYSVYPGSSSTFSVSNLFSSSSVSWTCSSNLSLSVSGNTATVSNSASLNDPQVKFCQSAVGWVKAAISGTSVVLQRDLATNTICVFDFSLPTYEYSSSGGYIYTYLTAPQTSEPTSIIWQVSNGNGVVWGDYNYPDQLFIFWKNGTYTVSAITYNDEVINPHTIRLSGLLPASCLAAAMTETCIVITLFCRGFFPCPGLPMTKSCNRLKYRHDEIMFFS